MSDDLVQFLRARLDEDVEVAANASPGPWHVNAESDEVLAADDITVAEGFALSGRQLRATTAHVARHDPARVLAEVEAKRRMIARIRYHAELMGWDEVHGDLLRLLASPYTDRPGYREEWRP